MNSWLFPFIHSSLPISLLQFISWQLYPSVAQAQNFRVTLGSSHFLIPTFNFSAHPMGSVFKTPQIPLLLSTFITTTLVLTTTIWHWDNDNSFLVSTVFPQGCSLLSSQCEPLKTWIRSLFFPQPQLLDCPHVTRGKFHPVLYPLWFGHHPPQAPQPGLFLIFSPCPASVTTVSWLFLKHAIPLP